MITSCQMASSPMGSEFSLLPRPSSLCPQEEKIMFGPTKIILAGQLISKWFNCIPATHGKLPFVESLVCEISILVASVC